MNQESLTSSASTETTEMPEPILISGPTSRRERREAARKERDSVSTWHNGRFGCWDWHELNLQEQIEFEMARRRSVYVQTFGVYA